MKLQAVIVDDDPVQANLLAAPLPQSSWSVRTFEAAGPAVPHVVATKPDLLVTDIYMPDVDGLAAIRSLRKEGYRGYILAVTAGDDFGSTPVTRIAEMLGADRAIRKSTYFCELERVMVEAVRRRAVIRAPGD